jgi:threonine aldolase
MLAQMISDGYENKMLISLAWEQTTNINFAACAKTFIDDLRAMYISTYIRS